ncbi:MAG: nucleotidyltransferase family protein [Pyrinomonadaceae bacterium]
MESIDKSSISSSLLSDDGYRWLLLRSRDMEMKTAAAAQLFAEAGVNAIVFKGWSVARWYPSERPRFYNDVDIAVQPLDHLNAERLRRDAEAVTPIDLHWGFRHYDDSPWDRLFSRTKIVKIDGIPVRVLCAEDELRIICAHWLNDGGTNKDRLWDIYYAVTNRQAGFDWDLCLNASGAHRSRWVSCAIQLAHKYLGLSLDGLPAQIRDYVVPGWVIRTIEREWESGIGLVPLLQCLSDSRLFWQQLKKRCPPNPIEATIEMSGDLSSPFRPYYQLGSFVLRARPSIKKIVRLAKIKAGRTKTE